MPAFASKISTTSKTLMPVAASQTRQILKTARGDTQAPVAHHTTFNTVTSTKTYFDHPQKEPVPEMAATLHREHSVRRSAERCAMIRQSHQKRQQRYQLRLQYTRVRASKQHETTCERPSHNHVIFITIASTKTHLHLHHPQTEPVREMAAT